MTQFRPIYKLRKIHSDQMKLAKSKNTYVLTIPNDVAILFNETSFYIYKSGTNIICVSGCSFNQIKQEAKTINIEQWRN